MKVIEIDGLSYEPYVKDFHGTSVYCLRPLPLNHQTKANKVDRWWNVGSIYERNRLHSSCLYFPVEIGDATYEEAEAIQQAVEALMEFVTSWPPVPYDREPFSAAVDKGRHLLNNNNRE